MSPLLNALCVRGCSHAQVKVTDFFASVRAVQITPKAPAVLADVVLPAAPVRSAVPAAADLPVEDGGPASSSRLVPHHMRSLTTRAEQVTTWTMLLWATIVATMVTVLFGSTLAAGNTCTPDCVVSPAGTIHAHPTSVGPAVGAQAGAGAQALVGAQAGAGAQALVGAQAVAGAQAGAGVQAVAGAQAVVGAQAGAGAHAGAGAQALAGAQAGAGVSSPS